MKIRCPSCECEIELPEKIRDVIEAAEHYYRHTADNEALVNLGDALAALETAEGGGG